MMKNILISNNKKKLDIAFVHEFLVHSYWAKGRTLEEVKASVNNSICYGVFKNEEQIGFARVVTDKVVFAYIMDVFIIEQERGNGYATKLMDFILKETGMDNVQQWSLKTKDAHRFYTKFGFNQIQNGKWFMEKICK